MNNQEFDMLAEKNPYIQSAYKQLQVMIPIRTPKLAAV